MQPDTDNLKKLEAWRDALVCPACEGALRVEAQAAACAQCGRVYPVVDGIPVLIVERAAVINRAEQ